MRSSRRSGAWQILDGTDGAASGVEPALNAALTSIDAIYAVKHGNATPTTRTSRLQPTCRSPGRSTASFRDSRPAPEADAGVCCSSSTRACRRRAACSGVRVPTG
jgi:hypothetical protein